MSRLGITFEQVELAAEKILAQGENPTIEKIRNLLGGTGSNTTLSKHLNEWRSQRLMATRDDLPAPHIPPDTVHAAVNRVWKEIHEEASLQVQHTREQARAEIEAIKKQIDSLQQTNNSLTQERDSLQQFLNQLTAEKETTVLDLKAVSQQNALLEERCQSLNQQYQIFKRESTARLADISRLHQQEKSQWKEHYNAFQNSIHQSFADIKNCQDTLQDRYTLEIDALKTEKQKKEKSITQLTAQFQKQQLQIGVLKTNCQQLALEKKQAIDLLAEQKKQIIQVLTTEFDQSQIRENHMIKILEDLHKNIFNEKNEKRKNSKKNNKNKQNNEETFLSRVTS